MSIVIFPGTFDPPTLGHLDIIRRSSDLFKEVIVLIAENPDKKNLLSVNKRVEILNEMISEFSNVQVDYYSGIVVEYAKLKGASALVRSIRDTKDFSYEHELYRANHIVSKDIDSVFLCSTPGMEGISSSLVRELYNYNADISRLVPGSVIRALED